MKILIIEDEEILVKVLQEKLERESFEVQVANDGEKALPIIKSFKPDIILLDIVLPKEGGLHVLEEIKLDGDISKIPVIMVSNFGEGEKIKKALKLGAMDYLVKTEYTMNEIVEKIKSYLPQEEK